MLHAAAIQSRIGRPSRLRRGDRRGLGANSPECREVARFVASGDTLSGFLRDLKARYPEMQGVKPDAAAQGANAPKTKADAEPTGSIRQKTPRRISAR
jgi:hypothetical protein